MTAFQDQLHGRACGLCGGKRELLVIVYRRSVTGLQGYYPAAYPVSARLLPVWYFRWHSRARARCIDRAACSARLDKRRARQRQRGAVLVLAEPKAPDAPLGTCRWCGEQLTGQNGARRNYCYPDREGRDCVREWNRSRVWDANVAVDRRGDTCCATCGSEGPWEADHEVALEDGGEHTLANLRRRCVPCHRAKTAAENSARAAARRAA